MAGINTSSKQYKTALKQMTSNANGAMYTNIQAIQNMMQSYDKDGDYIDPIPPGSLYSITRESVENFSKSVDTKI